MSNNPLYDKIIEGLEMDTKKMSIKTPVLKDEFLDIEELIASDERDDGLLLDEETILAVLKLLPKDQYKLLFILMIFNELGYHFTLKQLCTLWEIKPPTLYEKYQLMIRDLKKAHVEDII